METNPELLTSDRSKTARHSEFELTSVFLRLGSALSAASLLLAGCTTPSSPPASAPGLGGSAPIAAVSHSSPFTPDADSLTVEEAIKRVEMCNPQIQAFRAAVNVARQRCFAATDIEDPEVLGAWGNVENDLADTGDGADRGKKWRTGGRVFVPNPFLMAPRVSARSAELMAAKADLQAACWNIESDVRRAFTEWNYLSQDLALSQNLVHQHDEILTQVRMRARQGVTTAAEVISATRQRLQAQNNLDATEARYRAVQRELAALLDMPSSSLRLVSNSLDDAAPGESTLRPEGLENDALNFRADLSALHWRALAARSDYHEARNERIPWVKDVTAWHREPDQEWWVGMAVTVPLFSWTKNHNTDVLLAQDELANLNETNQATLVCREVRDAVDELENRSREQARNQAETVPLIAEMRESLDRLRSSAGVMPLEVATTEAQIIESSRLELAARWQFQLARLNLERAVGRPLSEVTATAVNTR